MSRGRRPHNRKAGRAAGGVGFALLVAAVAIVSFHLALNWPPDLPAGLMPASPGGLPPSRSVDQRADITCAVARINDGDTLRCRDGTRIRLHAVAARETDGSCTPGHPCPGATAEAATRTLQRLAGGQTIRCQSTGRSYNRVTAICWTPAGEEINCAMIRSGTTVIWDRFDRQERLCRG